MAGVQGAAGSFLQNIFEGGESPFGGMTSGLQEAAGAQIQGLLGQPAPEQIAFEQAQGALGNLMGGLQNPFTDMGAFNQAEQVNQAAQGLFQQNLQRAQGGLASMAPGRFSSALAQQGVDLSSQALQDFNLFQQQNLMQGLGLQNQQQQAALQFMLGAGGLQTEAAQTLGGLAGQAGMNPMERALGAGALGHQFTQGQINPLVQIMQGGLGFAQPTPHQAVIPGQNQLGQGLKGALGGGMAGAQMGSIFGIPGAAIGGGLGLLGGLFG
jgi:hypothetical protein